MLNKGTNKILELEPDVLRHWMKEYISAVVGEPVDSIDHTAQFLAFDLDSIDAVTMAISMENAFNTEVSPEMFLDGLTSIDEIVSQLCKQ
jgi:acyl carrier protein